LLAWRKDLIRIRMNNYGSGSWWSKTYGSFVSGTLIPKD
jgi:hypothetical protein